MEEFLKDPLKLFDVKNKTVVISGASGAFGSMASQIFAAAGANLLLASGNSEKLMKITNKCKSLGANVKSISKRPETEGDCEAIMDSAVDCYGSINILVVGSGLNDVSSIVDMSLDRYEKVMNGNVTGTWLLCRAFGKRAIQQGLGGKVILVSSARSTLGHPAGYSAYCASKAATDGITRALGCEWGKYKITVNAIAPTVFRSPLTAWMFEDTEKGHATRDGMLARIPLGRLGEPEDLAGPLLFLASKASDFYTGQVLHADGGYTAG